MVDQGPYGKTADLYWKKAWGPFPVKGKHEAIPRGVTGLAAKDPTWEQIQGWLAKRPFSNVAVLANGWVSIDVDEGGQDSLDAAQAELGQLPATWSSTSWGPDSPRRQHFYRVPVGFSARLAEGRFRKAYGNHVDIIHREHRYAIVAPSVHPDNHQPYRWYLPDGTAAGRKLPHRIEDLAELPQGWLDFLAYQAGTATDEVAADDDTDGFYDPAESSHGWTEVAARAEVARMLERIRTVDSNVNTQAGGAMREVGRFVPALFQMDEAVAMCRDALVANPWHEDAWNVANGKDWTAATLAATSVARGAEESRSLVAAEDGPEPQTEDERYTDAFMSERLVREALAGRFVYTVALGWLQHDGTRWVEVVDEIVHEATRKWTKAGYLAAVDVWRQAAANGATDKPFGEDPDIRGWAGLQGAGRITSVVKLARGIESVFRDASEFDQDPALLNTPNGIVDLRTGARMPHSASRMITKITNVAYVPEAESPALKTALEALPDDVPEWLQLMLGEAITGASGERMVLLTGGGRNGKTLLMGSVYRALGGYAAKVPNTLLLRSKQAGAATPERMTLRGIRLAYMEETPEDGYLDANVVKDLLDAEIVDGRNLYKPSTSWVPTHSIFLNTNHPPTITDTGEGAWRRMARVDFPYRYRKPDEALENPNDRRGDPRLKAALGRSREGQEALLAWLVAGAVRYYAAGSIEEAGPTPASVTGSVRKWRHDSDDILRFVDEHMDFNLDTWVSGADLYREFVRFQKAHGQMPLSQKAFTARLESHSALPGSVTRVSWLRDKDGLSRPGLMVDGYVEPLPARVKGWNGLAFKIDQTAFELEE
jgi:P4 family phage/plasmid primase-like protien